MGKKLTKEIFLERSNVIHENKYDYFKVEYKNVSTKVIINCPIHSEFFQTPDKHLLGQGCPKCAGNLKLDTNEFIKRSKEIHGFKYDYLNIDYKDMLTKVIIICKEHGSFEQTPNNHINLKQGCIICSGKKVLNNREFIKKSRSIHGYEYSYKNAYYLNNKTNVNITCKKHGDFIQTPSKHFLGQGCPFCYGGKLSNIIEFVKKSNIIHGNNYDYNNSIYINSKIKLKITCKNHGEFLQKPNNHLQGEGCPSCNKSKGEIIIQNILNINNIKYKSQYYFSDLKNIRYLRFDFAILDEFGNLKCLIEYNGKQHYEKFEKFQTDIAFLEQLKRDKMKIDYCKKNNIYLFIIKYDQNINKEMYLILEKEEIKYVR